MSKPYVDHLVYAGPNLEQLISRFAKQSGVKAIFGGRHENYGTHNALASLGAKSYLELISPDPSNSIEGGVTILDIGKLTSPKIVAWAMGLPDFDKTHICLSKDFEVSEIGEGERITPEGKTLSWRYFYVNDEQFSEIPQIVPFFIDWKSDHPAENSPQGSTLVKLVAYHPTPQRFTGIFETLDFEICIEKSEYIALEAHFDSPLGQFAYR